VLPHYRTKSKRILLVKIRIAAVKRNILMFLLLATYAFTPCETASTCNRVYNDMLKLAFALPIAIGGTGVRGLTGGLATTKVHKGAFSGQRQG